MDADAEAMFPLFSKVQTRVKGKKKKKIGCGRDSCMFCSA
jgi:hypothetical protein